MISLDTETTGLDLRHGARPFLVTTCDEAGVCRFWEWGVDPLTRRVEAPPEDLREVRALVEGADRLVLQNGKFDAAVLATVLPDLRWPWERCEDTLIAGHLLHSGQPHSLDAMALLYLGKDIRPLEEALREAVMACRRQVQQARLAVKRGRASARQKKLASWRIAEEGLPEMPSARGGRKDAEERGAERSAPWKHDAWLPRALFTSGLSDDPQESWLSVCADYANGDSGATLPLFRSQLAEIKRRGLESIYRQRMHDAESAWDLERRGVTYCPRRLGVLRREFSERRDAARRECLGIAARLGADLELPAGASPNGSLRRFMFETLKVPPVRGVKAKTSAPTLDKNAMAFYEQTLTGDAGTFVRALTAGRKLDTQLAFMSNYERHGLPSEGGMVRLFQSANPTGTEHLRWGFANPNMANVSKQDEMEAGRREARTLRWLFGPGPGREWWKFDFENLELRIPGYEAPEPAMIELFEHPERAPFFGSYHLLNASIVYPDLFWPIAEQRGEFKKRYEASWYQWIKNAGFALIYGCQEDTFDRTAHKAGGYALLRQRLPNLFRLAERWITHAERHGLVETLPDREVDPKRGYPIECSRSEWGRVSPTIPLNYHVSGTAMQCTNKAMWRTRQACAEWSVRDGRDYFLTLQVHDELVFDFPAGGRHNLPKVRALQALMEESGDDIGVPLKVAVAWHPRNWGEAEDPLKEVNVA